MTVHLQNMFIHVKLNEEISLDDHITNNKFDYNLSVDIILNPQNNNVNNIPVVANNIPIVANNVPVVANTVDISDIDLKNRELNTLASLVYGINIQISALIENCVTIRNDISNRLRQRINVNQIQITF